MTDFYPYGELEKYRPQTASVSETFGGRQARNSGGLELQVTDMVNRLSSPDWHIRHDAAHRLGYFHDQAADQALVRALEDSDPSMRWAAIRALGALERADLVSLLVALTERFESFRLRQGARNVLKHYLARHPQDDAFRAVLDAIENPVPEVATPWAAHKALASLNESI